MRQSLRHRLAAVAATAVLATAAGCSSAGPPAPGPSSTRDGSVAPGPTTPAPTPSWNARPASVAALGDSISRGFDACSLLSDCPEVSWVTGTGNGVGSVAGRLSALAAGRNWNLANTGARMSDLPGQVARAVPKKPALVTVLMGANDACRVSVGAMTPVTEFRSDFTRSMTALRRGLPTTQVLVASIPDLRRLWEVGKDNPMGRRVWNLGICPSMLGDAGSTAPAAIARRAAVRARVVAYNKVLRDVCRQDERCRYDGGAVFDYRFTAAELSPWDFFHPSRRGQAELARIVYHAVAQP